MKKSSILSIAIILILLLIGSGSYYFYFKKKATHTDDNNAATTKEDLRQTEIFSGDVAYLVKGKLLDEGMKSEYDRIPDTLIMLSFGDKLYCTTCPLVNDEGAAIAVDASGVIKPGEERSKYEKHYSLYQKATPNPETNTALGANDRWNATYAYLKLAESGKAEFPKIFNPNGQLWYTMLSWTSFDEKYRDYFTLPYTEEIPYGVKDQLIKLFNSDDGKNLGFVSEDQRNHQNLIRYGDFTGKNNRETACVLANTKESAQTTQWEKLPVYAYNGQAEAYLLYSEDFRDKILIEPIKQNSSGLTEISIYTNSEEKRQTHNDALRIKIPNQPDVVLVYNKEFDKMDRFLQVPLSQINRINDEE